MADQPDPRVVALVDQLLAAQKDVADLIGSIAPDLKGWRKVDEWTSASIDRLLSRALAEHGRSARICPHAWASILGGAPRPQVLDADRGIMACLEGCYAVRVTSAEYGHPGDAVHCFDCGRPVGSVPQGNLLIAYGPVLVLGSLCERCDREWPGSQRRHPDG
jgi:hypothetical protein